MVKIDLKDRKILYHLDLNCRQSNTQIGKKVGLSKDVVSYRINRMEDEGIIKNYWTEIDTYQLGYSCSRLYLSLQNATPTIRKTILDHLATYPNLWALLSIHGPFDIDLIFWVKEFTEFNPFWDDTLQKFGDYIVDSTFSVVSKLHSYKRSYILPNDYDPSDRKNFNILGTSKTCLIDKTDVILLNEIVNNARIPLIELAEKLKCSSQTVNYRLKKLAKDGVIRGFRVGIDLSKLGLESFGLSLLFRNPMNKNAIIKDLQKNPHTVYIIFPIGFSDLQLEFHIQNSDELVKIIDQLNLKYPNTIRKFSFYTISKVHKERWLPEIY